MILDAREEFYELGELDGKTIAFTNMRLDRETIPEGVYCYDVRDSDLSDGSFAQLKKFVCVNHWGTVLCGTPFELDETGGYYPEADDMSYFGKVVTLEGFVELMQEEQEAGQSKKIGMSMTG